MIDEAWNDLRLEYEPFKPSHASPFDNPNGDTFQESIDAMRRAFEQKFEFHISSPLKWWKANGNYPNICRLVKMVRAILAIPASSASVERLFSSANFLNPKFRQAQSSETLRKQLELRSVRRQLKTADHFLVYAAKALNQVEQNDDSITIND